MGFGTLEQMREVARRFLHQLGIRLFVKRVRTGLSPCLWCLASAGLHAFPKTVVDDCGRDTFSCGSFSFASGEEPHILAQAPSLDHCGFLLPMCDILGNCVPAAALSEACNVLLNTATAVQSRTCSACF